VAGQNVERREVLRILSLAASAALSPQFSRWSFGGSQHDAGHHAAEGKAESASPRGPYRPQFFSAGEYAAIAALTERIIPTDDTPGAREAGVSEFVDFMVWSDPNVQERFRKGLAWVEGRARAGYGGKGFAALRAEEQDAILTTMAEAVPGGAKDEGAAFFHLIRQYTVMGFYTSKVGMEQIGDPRLQTMYKDPGCRHLDDPEHRRLRPSGG
jgi:gluconate 2-dehydrogenase gamma chain